MSSSTRTAHFRSHSFNFHRHSIESYFNHGLRSQVAQSHIKNFSLRGLALVDRRKKSWASLITFCRPAKDVIKRHVYKVASDRAHGRGFC